MKKKIIRNLCSLTLISALFPVDNSLQAGAGKSFGYFALGGVTGGLVGSAIAKRNRKQPQVVEREVVRTQPVYVQAPPSNYQAKNQQAELETLQQINQLQRENQQLLQENNRLRQQAQQNNEKFDETFEETTRSTRRPLNP